MGDTTSTAIISPRVISMVADSTEAVDTEAVDTEAVGTEAVATVRREEEMTDSRESRSNAKYGQALASDFSAWRLGVRF